MHLLADFLRVWYDGRELNSRLNACGSDSRARAYLESALETMESSLPIKLRQARTRELTQVSRDNTTLHQTYQSFDFSSMWETLSRGLVTTLVEKN